MSRTARSGALLVVLLVTSAGGQAIEHVRAAPPPRAPAATSPANEDRALLRQLADAQRNLGEELEQLKEHVDALNGELAAQRDRDNALEQEIKAARDEIKGLYVESSSVKQAIEELKEDVAGVNSNVSAFRTFSGFFIAVMILLLAVIFVLSIRR
jgi:peptidoglycan hydrolase CwlO-like protein